VAVEAVVNQQEPRTALIMAAAHATALSRGFHPLIAQSSGVRAAELLAEGQMQGSALVGAESYAEVRSQQFSAEAAAAASTAACAACEAACEREVEITNVLARGGVPEQVRKQATASAFSVAEAIQENATAEAAEVAGRAAAVSLYKGHEAVVARGAGKAASRAMMAGCSQKAALIAGLAAGESIESGFSPEESLQASEAAALAFDKGLSYEEALQQGKDLIELTNKDIYTLALLDEEKNNVKSWAVGDESLAIAADDGVVDDSKVQAYVKDLLTSDDFNRLVEEKQGNPKANKKPIKNQRRIKLEETSEAIADVMAERMVGGLGAGIGFLDGPELRVGKKPAASQAIEEKQAGGCSIM